MAYRLKESTDVFAGGTGPNRSHEQVVAARVLERPEILAEIIHLLSWTEPETLDSWIEAMQREKAHRDEVLTACKEGNFGAKFVASKVA